MPEGIFKLKELFKAVGVQQIYAKPLVGNDNSKNQIYLGGGFSALDILPFESPEISANGKQIKAKIDLNWLSADGNTEAATSAQLILYPQYPEVRMSGFLRGTTSAPNEHIKRALAPSRRTKSSKYAQRTCLVFWHRWKKDLCLVGNQRISNFI